MSKTQFAKALAQLKVSRNRAGDVLGISRASVYNYLAGTQDVPAVVERLIALLQKHGVPKEWRA